jgi:hypothetical protein
VFLSCEKVNVSAMKFSPHIPLDMPEPATRLVIATVGQRHRPADSRSELNGPDRPCAGIFSHLPGHK